MIEMVGQQIGIATVCWALVSSPQITRVDLETVICPRILLQCRFVLMLWALGAAGQNIRRLQMAGCCVGDTFNATVMQHLAAYKSR